MQPSHEWFDDLVDDTRASLASYVRRFVSAPEDAQEITQEAYLQVFCALRNEDRREHQPIALLYTAARNIAISRLRHRQVIRRSTVAVTVAEELRSAGNSTEQKAGTQQKMQSLLLAVNKLPPRCRTVFVLRMIEGLSQRAIAERLAISVSTVEKHLSRGLRLCRTELQAEGRETELAEYCETARTGT